MEPIRFKRIAPHEPRIYLNGELVSDVCPQADYLHPGAHYYTIHLDEDHHGPVRVHERSRIRDIAERLIRTHRFL